MRNSPQSPMPSQMFVKAWSHAFGQCLSTSLICGKAVISDLIGQWNPISVLWLAFTFITNRHSFPPVQYLRPNACLPNVSVVKGGRVNAVMLIFVWINFFKCALKCNLYNKTTWTHLVFYISESKTLYIIDLKDLHYLFFSKKTMWLCVTVNKLVNVSDVENIRLSRDVFPGTQRCL